MGYKRRAMVKVLDRAPYNGAAIKQTLKRLGYQVVAGPPADVGPGDVIVTWNRYQRDMGHIQAFEAGGGKNIVFENSPLGRTRDGGPWYSVAVGGHNGAGVYREPDIMQFGRLNYPVREWGIKHTGTILFLATRHMGAPDAREPKSWLAKAMSFTQQKWNLTAKVRAHPGPQYAVPEVALEDDLKDTGVAITWGSSAGIKAILAGYPVFYGFDRWVGGLAAQELFKSDVLHPACVGRGPLIAQLATVINSLGEVEAGDPLAELLGV